MWKVILVIIGILLFLGWGCWSAYSNDPSEWISGIFGRSDNLNCLFTIFKWVVILIVVLIIICLI